MTRQRVLLAMLAASVLAGAAGWRRERAALAGFDRRLMVDGARAVAVSAREYDLRILRTGDHVDVLVVFDANARGTATKYAATILQNEEVLGVIHAAKPEGGGAVYLMLNPSSAQYAALSARQGDVTIVLRKAGDREIHPMEMSDYRNLFR